ncbi:tetratricopeptide repeat protein [Rodentibacter caecimuris]|uniref:Sel1 repeat family protein n=1 Tax=Rodentibacter caecimuris TaxID=1796644 RepID=A0ABX3KXV5_9PAST|nr:hypothetical protein BKG89_05480 [Rodentibacter heylii]
MKVSKIFIFLGLLLSHSVSAMKTIDADPYLRETEQKQINQVQEWINMQNWQKVFELLYPLATAGNLQAQSNLAVMYNIGKGVAQNKEKAYWWFSEAAEQGHIKAINNLAVMYLNGEYVKQDISQAIKLLEKTANANNQEAMLILGEIFFRQKEYRKSFDWFKKSATLGNVEGKFRLGLLYEEGKGVSINKDKAIKLYREILASNIEQSMKQRVFERLSQLEGN